MSPVRAAAEALFGDAVFQAVRSESNARPAKVMVSAARLTGGRLLLVVAVGLIMLAGVGFSPHVFEDGDTYWHLASGQWMLRHHAILHADPFSYTAPGKAWDTHEWLTEVIMTGVWQALGWAGLQLMFAAAAAVTAMIMAAELSRKLPAVSWIATLALALACTAQSWLARPHLLALPILALWTIELLRAREAGRAPSLWLIPVMSLWANLHGSFLIGLALIVPIACEAVLAAPDRLRAGRSWLAFLLAATAAAIVTPHGLNGLIYPIQIQSMKTLQNIQEWRSADFGQIRPFELALAAALYVLLSRGARIPMIRLLTLLGLLHLALHEVRHQLVFAVIAPLLLADALRQALRPEGPAAAGKAPGRRLMAGALAGMAVAAVAVAGARLWISDTPKDGPTAPGTALAHVPQALRARPVLNEYGMGGFLIFKGVRPFIDGRADMYGDDFFDAYVKAVQPDRAKLAALLGKYKVQWTILDAKDPAVQVLDGMAGWKRLYADKYAVVHIHGPAGPGRDQCR